ncbi:MAG TPA: hypothetical protein PKN22_12195 [Taishania sp.]|nr:hypothetical protein [Taishania sp.]
MKHLLLLLVAFSLFSCTKKQDKACTALFAMITIQVKDTLNNPVLLDSTSIFVPSTNSYLSILTDDFYKSNGEYVVFSDEFIHLTSEKKSLEIIFKGFKNNSLKVNESIKVSQDGCHVTKVSGNSSVIVQ